MSMSFSNGWFVASPSDRAGTGPAARRLGMVRQRTPLQLAAALTLAGAVALASRSACAQAAAPAVPAVQVTPARAISVQGVQITPSGGAIMVPAPGQVQPAGGIVGVGAEGGAAMASPADLAAATGLSVDQLGDLRRLFDASSEEERALLRAYYADLGIDLDIAVGRKPLTPGDGTAAPPAMPLPELVKQLDFTRTPQAVLAARSKLGFGSVERPKATDTQALANWFHTQFLAGEWPTVTAFLAELPAADGKAIYAHLLQSANRRQQQQGDPNQRPDPPFLPEEVLSLADVAPSPLEDWQVDVLAQLFKLAASRYSTTPALASIAEGTKQFGRDGTREPDPKRERTVRFLVNAGMTVDAFAYFPDLEIARSKADAKALLNHGRYHQDFAASPKAGDTAESHLRTAWELFREVTLLEGADGPTRQDALRRAIDLLPQMPPAQGAAWLKQVFASNALAPAALEAIALKAVGLRSGSGDNSRRAQTILTMKDAVGTLLVSQGGAAGENAAGSSSADTVALNAEAIRVPLRMLTTALVNEIEASFEVRQQPQWGRVQNLSRDMEFLLRALPDERWMASLEPSLASRAYRASIGLSLKTDEVDLALGYLRGAVQRFPNQAVELADSFLRQWEERMRTASQPPQEEYYFYGREPLAAAPLTRGRQRRNLDRLSELIAVMDSIGLDPRRLPSVALVFRACHGRTEAFTHEGIEAIFGPIDRLAPETAAALAEQMRVGLGGDWRDRRAQQALGVKRTQSEVAEIIERGYALAIQLIDIALSSDASAWRHAVTKAGLTYDRVQFKQADEKKDFATYNQYRKEAFDAFAQTAARYAQLVSDGAQRDDPAVYLAWFNAAVGSTELNYLTRDDLLIEGSPQDDQIDQIRKSIDLLPGDAGERHIGAFARAISEGIGTLEPDVKPRIVRHALRIIGDHPAGAALQRLNDLYRDLVKDEIKLRLTVDGGDGGDRIREGQTFGAALTLRYTDQVDRETGGFSRYLQNDVFMRFGMTWRSMNYRDLLKKNVEGALAERFEIEALGFFDPMIPGRSVKEGGQDGWMEKPLVYVTLRPKDRSVDRLPQVSMDLQFNDTVGPVTLPVVSNAPPIAIEAAATAGGGAGEAAPLRPIPKLEVTQILDLRDIDDSSNDRRITLEVIARGEGVLPELERLLPDLRAAMPGYTIDEKGIESRPPTLIENDRNALGGFGGMVFGGGQPQPKPEAEFPGPDENGVWRLASERSWLVTFTPSGGSVGSTFTLPPIAEGLGGTLVAKQYTDMDVVPITGLTVAVVRSPWSARNALIAAVGVLGLFGAAVLWSRRRRPEATDERVALPDRITPLSVIAALRRIESDRALQLGTDDRARLAAEIGSLERTYFGPTPLESAARESVTMAELKPTGEANRGTAGELDVSSLRAVLERWARRATS
jgi:hypothetical protein